MMSSLPIEADHHDEPGEHCDQEGEERKAKLDALRARLAEGAAQATGGEYVHGYSVERLIADLDTDADVLFGRDPT
jgi:hypothetical protein